MPFDKLILSNHIDHSTSIEQGERAEDALIAADSAGARYIAVTKKGKLVGVASRDKLSDRILASEPFKAKITDCLLPHSLHCQNSTPLAACIEQTLNRTLECFHDDIVVVDENNKFCGFISVKTLLSLQHSFINLQEPTITAAEWEAAQSAKSADSHNPSDEFKQLRSTFISRFSYEAISPMNSIKGVLDLLRDSNLSQEHKQLVQSAFITTDTLLRLIQNTSDYAKIQSNEIEFSKKPFSPLDAITKTFLSLQSEASEKGLTLDLSTQDLPKEFIGDEAQLRHILKNIIGRAIENTIIGGIAIRATTSPSRAAIVIEITDTGSPLEETAESVYGANPLLPADSADIATLVSQIILKKMGGHLAFDHSIESGERFIISLPIECPVRDKSDSTAQSPEKLPTPATANKVEARALSEDETLEVLIIDDNPVNVKVAECFLKKLNCNIHSANSGQEGIGKLSKLPIDCIFMDCQMPKLSGYEVTQMIRHGDAGVDKSSVFISAMTAHTDAENQILCSEAGMNHFIAKPISLKVFTKAIEECRQSRLANTTQAPLWEIT